MKLLLMKLVVAVFLCAGTRGQEHVMASFSEAETALSQSHAKIDQVLATTASPDAVKANKGKVADAIRWSEKQLQDAALALETSRRATVLAKISMKQVRADAKVQEEKAKLDSEQIQKATKDDFNQLKKLKKDLLENHHSTMEDVEANMRARELGMQEALSQAEKRVHAMKESHAQLSEHLLKTQSLAAAATKQVQQATEDGAGSQTIEIMKRKEASKLGRADSAMASEQEANEKLKNYELAAQKQKELVGVLHTKGAHVKSLITLVREAQDATNKQSIVIDALTTKSSIVAQEQADEEQHNAVKAALKYADLASEPA